MISHLCCKIITESVPKINVFIFDFQEEHVPKLMFKVTNGAFLAYQSYLVSIA